MGGACPLPLIQPLGPLLIPQASFVPVHLQTIAFAVPPTGNADPPALHGAGFPPSRLSPLGYSLQGPFLTP